MKGFCAHRGVSKLMPENTIPAFAAAIAFDMDVDTVLTNRMDLAAKYREDGECR